MTKRNEQRQEKSIVLQITNVHITRGSKEGAVN